MYTLLLALIYLSFISLGLPDSLLGAGWPVMYQAFDVPLSYMGIVSILTSGTTIVSSLLADRLTRKFGTNIVTVVSVFVSAAALLCFSVANQFWMLLVFAIPYGLSAGAIDAALNNYVAQHYSSKLMSWLHCFWGVGSIISPLVMSYALTTSVWATGYRIVALLQLIIGLVLLVTLPVWKINQAKVERVNRTPVLGLRDALKIKGVPTLLLGFFGYCSAEATGMGWACTYLVEVRHIGEETAAAFASFVFIGLTAGRFLGGFIMDRLGDRKMIYLGAGIALCGILLIMLPIPGDLFALIGFGVLGLGFAPIYPCIIHSTPGNFGAENAGAIIGIQMASAYIGATLMPPLYGLLGKFLGFQILPGYLVIFILLMLSMIARTFRVTGADQNKTGSHAM